MTTNSTKVYLPAISRATLNVLRRIYTIGYVATVILGGILVVKKYRFDTYDNNWYSKTYQEPYSMYYVGLLLAITTALTIFEVAYRSYYYRTVIGTGKVTHNDNPVIERNTRYILWIEGSNRVGEQIVQTKEVGYQSYCQYDTGDTWKTGKK